MRLSTLVIAEILLNILYLIPLSLSLSLSLSLTHTHTHIHTLPYQTTFNTIAVLQPTYTTLNRACDASCLRTKSIQTLVRPGIH